MPQPQPHVPTLSIDVDSTVSEKSHTFFALLSLYRAYRKSLTCLLSEWVGMARGFLGKHTRSISPIC